MRLFHSRSSIFHLRVAAIAAALAALVPPAQAYEWQNELLLDRDNAFMSGPGWFTSGPAWLMKSMPGANFRARQYLIVRSGDTEQSSVPNGYVGTLANPFNVMLFNNVSTFVGAGGSKTVIPLSPDATNGTGKDFFQNSAMTSASNYTPASPSATPTNTDDVRITTPTSNNPLVISSANVVMESLSVTNGSSYTIGNNTSVATNRTLTLGNSSGFTNVFSLVSNDLIYLTSSSGLVIQGPNLQSGQSTGTGALGLVLASSGNFNVGSGSTLNISSIISGSGISITLSNSGTVLFGGVNTYSGDTIINAGDLRFNIGASSNSSTIRLGNTSGSALATLSLGNGGTGGVSLTSPLEVRSGGTGPRVIRSLDTAGTDTFGGAVTMNGNLTVEPRTGNTLLFQGGSFDLKTNTLTIDSQNDQNGADNVNFQGTVKINELIAGAGGAIVKDGSATLILQGVSNTYTGGTTIKGGTLGIFGDRSLGAVPTTEANNIFFAASSASNPTAIHTLRADAAGISLSANRDINIASGVTATFDSNGNTFTINGSMNGSGNIAKTGAGTLTLTGPNFVTGTATINTNGGTLNAAANSALGSGFAGTAIGPSSITVNSGGTLMLSTSGQTDRVRDDAPISLGGTIGRGTGTFTEGTGAVRTAPGPVGLTGTSTVGLGALTLTSNATIDFNLLSTSGVATFNFAGFTPGTFTLNILNWTSSNANFTAQTSGIDGTDDRLIFAGALPPAVSNITFNGAPAGVVALDAGFYEVVPIPEPSTWIGAALALAAIGFTQRKRLSRSFQRA